MPPLIETEHLAVHFDGPQQGLLKKRLKVKAVRDATFSIEAGETFGLVGESGSGKSTTGRAMVGLVKLTAGVIRYQDQDLARVRRSRLADLRRQMNMVFQDPYSSLDPSMRIEDIIAEPVDARGGTSRKRRSQMITEALNEVGLSPQLRARYPNEFSGGQRQRIAIARAIVLRPKFIVCDEAVSALDVSTKNQIIDLLQRVQREHGATYLFISHDLGIVRNISNRVAVMYAGGIVEVGPADRICSKPAHPYSAALVSASPIPHPRRERQRTRIVLEGDPPSPLSALPGCPFQARCPFTMDICRTVMPAPRPVEGGGTVSCHLHDTGPKLEGRPIAALITPQGLASAAVGVR